MHPHKIFTKSFRQGFKRGFKYGVKTINPIRLIFPNPAPFRMYFEYILQQQHTMLSRAGVNESIGTYSQPNTKSALLH